MNLRFIGENSSMGLTHGKIYKVSIDVEYGHVVVRWAGGFCPYSSLRTLMENWEDVR